MEKKIIYEDPETRQRTTVIIDDRIKINSQEGFVDTAFEQWHSFYLSAKASEMIMLPGKGRIPKMAIKGIFDVKEVKKEEILEEHRMEKDPPNKDEWKAILTHVYFRYGNQRGRKPLPETALLGIAKSIWDWNSQATLDAIEDGEDLMKKREENN